MIYYIVKGQVFTVFLSLLHLTSISFPSRINDYVGGQKGDFKVHELNKTKSLVFEPKRKGFTRNFITFLKDSKYHFNLEYNEKLSNKDIVIEDAIACSFYTLLLETSNFQLFECPKSLCIINKSNKPIIVNDFNVEKQAYLSKGPPIYINSKLLYYQGRLL